MENEYSSKEIVKDIISMQRFLPKFLELGKDYNDVIEYFLSLEISHDYTPYPSIKELQEILGIKYSALRKKLNQLYVDLSRHEEFGIEFSIDKVEYVFWLQYFDQRKFITINHLPIIPRVGEQIRFPFFGEMIGTEYFHVAKIDHYLSDTVQSINIKLESSGYNLFWHIKKDEEYEKGNMSFNEYHSSPDYILKKRFSLRG
jgi:hypothetical protein